MPYIVMLPAEINACQEAYGPFTSREGAEKIAGDWSANHVDEPPAFVLDLQSITDFRWETYGRP